MASPPPQYSSVENHSTLEHAQHSTLEAVYHSPDHPPEPDNGAQTHYAPGDTGTSAKEAISAPKGDTLLRSEEQGRSKSRFMQRRVWGMRMRSVLVLAAILVLLIVVGAVVGGVVGSRKDKAKEDPPTETVSNGTTTNGTDAAPQSLEELINSTTSYPLPREPRQKWRFKSMYWYTIEDYRYEVKYAHENGLNITSPTPDTRSERLVLIQLQDESPEANRFGTLYFTPLSRAIPTSETHWSRNWQFLAVPTAISERFVKPGNYSQEGLDLYFDWMLYWISSNSYDDQHPRLSLVKEEWESYANLSLDAQQSVVLNITHTPRHIDPELQLWYVASEAGKPPSDEEPLYLFNYRTGHNVVLGYDESSKDRVSQPIMQPFHKRSPNLKIANTSLIDPYNDGGQFMDFNTCLDGNPC